MIARSSKWQLQEAKNKLRPRRGSADDYGAWEDAVTISRAAPATRDSPPKENLWEYFQRSPAAGIEFFIPHIGDLPSRDVSFLFEDDDE